MEYRIEFRSSALKEILSLSKQEQDKLRSSIDNLAHEPRPTGCRKLKGFNGLFRIRIGDLRIIYEVSDSAKVVKIIKVGNRGDIYKNL